MLDYPPDLSRIAPSHKMRVTLSGARSTFRLKRVTCVLVAMTVRFGAELIPATEPSGTELIVTPNFYPLRCVR